MYTRRYTLIKTHSQYIGGNRTFRFTSYNNANDRVTREPTVERNSSSLARERSRMEDSNACHRNIFEL